MAATSGCQQSSAPRRDRGYDRTTWTGCEYGASIDLLVHDGGHTVPLSWFSAAIDWFEAGSTRPSGMPEGGGTAVFRGAGDRGPSSQTGGGSFFKKAPATRQ